MLLIVKFSQVSIFIFLVTKLPISQKAGTRVIYNYYLSNENCPFENLVTFMNKSISNHGCRVKVHNNNKRYESLIVI